VAGDTQSTPHLDEYGLLQQCCFRSHLEGRSIGYAEGISEGRRQVQDESWTLACQVVNGAARSIDVMAARAKPYTIPRWAL